VSIHELDDLNTARHAWSTLVSLIELLPDEDRQNLAREFTKAGLDIRNPMGESAFQCYKTFVLVERNAAEAFTEPERATKTLAKTLKAAHVVGETQEDNDHYQQDSFEIQPSTYAVQTPSRPWYRAGSKFPCPIRGCRNARIDRSDRVESY